MRHMPPTDIWDVSDLLTYEEPLEEGDPLYVDTGPGRGEFSMNRLYRHLGVRNDNGLSFMKPKKKEYVVFCGHRGCGKSTELRRLASILSRANLFFVVFLDITKELDFNNLQYPDVLMALAKTLLTRIQEAGIDIPKDLLEKLEKWFTQKVYVETRARDSSAIFKGGGEVKTGLPLISKLFAGLTISFKTNATYKNELRRSIKNNFSEFAYAFNQLVEITETALQETGKAKKLLFIIDGTDRANSDDSKRFFVEDAHQLQLIDANFIYCCPIHLLHEGGGVRHIFKHHILPMIKLTNREGTQRFEPGFEVLRKMILRRADRSLFDDDETIDMVIENSGGNPREVIRLLEKAFSLTKTERFDRPTLTAAVKDLATDYRRFLRYDAYHILWAIDHGLKLNWNLDQENNLLLSLALLEYNSFWRRSHPIIRNLDEYKELTLAVVKESLA